MKNCPNCNAQLEDDAVFCTECGQSMAAPVTVEANSEAAAPTAGEFCPFCGAPLPAGTVFCPKCGKNTAEGSATTNQVSTGEAGATQNLMKNPIAIVAVVAVVLLVFVLAFRGGDNTSGNSSSTAEKPTISVKAKDMLDDYIRDQSSAEQKYKNKTVYITGNLISKYQFNNSADYGLKIASQDVGGRYYVIVIDAGSNVKAVNSIKEGDFVTATGKCVGIVPQKSATTISVQIQASKINE